MNRRGRLIRRIRMVFYTLAGLAAFSFLTAVVSFFVLLDQLPRVPEPLSRIIERPPTEIYAATGERVLVLGGREAVPLNRISPRFVEAVVAVEDHRFWSHHGIDKIRLTRAFLDGLAPHRRVRGTSTITQQLAKNLFFSLDRSLKRKFLEILVACQIESRYSKEEILQAYINNTSFGVNALGIEQASRSFFGKPASDLNLAEASLLAGLPQSPSGYNPYRHMDRAKRRQRTVLGRMAAVGYITPKESDEAFESPLDLRPRQASGGGSYFLDKVIRDLEERYGPEVVYNGGLRVTTTLDIQLQRWAAEAVEKGAGRLDREIGLLQTNAAENQTAVPQVALAAVDVNSGAVKAVVGGRDYFKSEYNRAVQNNRQPGSGFKPFLYYAALDSPGITPATVFTDKKVTIPVRGAPDWTPDNFGREHAGPMILKRALMNSVNSIAAQLIVELKPAGVIETARKCGISSPLAEVYSIALGTSGASPLEMASAFGVFASGGVRHEPFWIWRVEDAYGRALEEHIVSGENALNPETVFQLVDMLRGVVDRGTAQAIRTMGFSLPAAGKTGTSNDYMDAWFTGFTPGLSVSIWTGYDAGKGLRDRNGVGITGGRAAAPIWADFMIKATGGEPAREFTVPPGIHFETVDDRTGYLTEEGSPNALRVALKPGQNPEPAPPAFYAPAAERENERPSAAGPD
ncbi:MAG: PBP1A family penicillin-binding protein [Acidobacteria bacterium]|nr:PBP1A family penicillin-binding protein [Acidobacteriota bacterium]